MKGTFSPETSFLRTNQRAKQNESMSNQKNPRVPKSSFGLGKRKEEEKEPKPQPISKLFFYIESYFLKIFVQTFSAACHRIAI